MKISVLGSGSSGNSVLVADSNSSILVDAGFSGKNLRERLEGIGWKLDFLRAILVTHEHIDHIRGVGVLARKLNIPVFATKLTLKQGKHILGNLPNVEVMEPGVTFNLGQFQIHPFSVSHDAVDPVGFRITSQELTLGICTDLGYVTNLVRQRLINCNALVMETNHDMEMLLAGSYPWYLKQRIRSKIGHLSNDTAAEFIKSIWHPSLNRIFLAHLSRENNIPQLAEIAVNQALAQVDADKKTIMEIAQQGTPSQLYSMDLDMEFKESD